MNKWHKEAMLQTAIKVMKQHSPSLESYVEHYWESFVRSCTKKGVKPTIEAFYETVPKENRHLHRRTNMVKPYTDELLDELEDELKKVEPKENPKHPKKD
jgi:wyosine [tRNA(Phe)-imidazoG37] synthetase (radical SAM superfamily)